MLQERYIVDWETDGQIAWDYLDCEDFSYAIVVLDWLLPGISGLTILQRMRDRGLITPVPTLTLLSYNWVEVWVIDDQL